MGWKFSNAGQELTISTDDNAKQEKWIATEFVKNHLTPQASEKKFGIVFRSVERMHKNFRRF